VSYEAKVLADSISPIGKRLTTLQVTYPHAIHKDIMTHRALSRNFLSFRAYPPEKLYEMLTDENCFIPEVFTERRPGMSGGVPLSQTQQDLCVETWLAAKAKAVLACKRLVELGVAKEQANIPIQDYCWITGIVSATTWDNFFGLRLEQNEDGTPKARPEVYKIASMMRAAIEGSEPKSLRYGDWHLPLVTPIEAISRVYGINPKGWDYWKKVSTGRCARISYLTHDGVRDPEKDIELHDKLLEDIHMSPFEQVARPARGYWENAKESNFDGWWQYRKDIPGESNVLAAKGAECV
jgi:hypothetical protein